MIKLNFNKLEKNKIFAISILGFILGLLLGTIPVQTISVFIFALIISGLFWSIEQFI